MITLHDFDIANTAIRTRYEIRSARFDGDSDIFALDYSDNFARVHSAIERLVYYCSLGDGCQVDFVKIGEDGALDVVCFLYDITFDDYREKLMKENLTIYG